MEQSSRLLQLKINLISPNPENPRIIFRQEEMDSLLISIKKYGVQVPIAVYKDGDNYFLIDGERRWKTCKKLNHATIPAIIQEKPSRLDNLLMMFNIHSLREQWDLLTIANKITSVIELLTKRNDGVKPNETQLSEETGLKRIAIRRCRLLIELPQKYKNMMLEELEKPKSQQKLTEDFFIEMETPLKSVIKRYPKVIDDLNIVRDNLIKKYLNGTINNIVDFRKIAKIATSPHNVDYPIEKALDALNKIFYDDSLSIDIVYNSTVASLYEEKKLISNFSNVLFYIENLSIEEMHDKEIRSTLKKMKIVIEKILEN